ncbi:MAG TPA: cytochrome c-type biogenesis protein CcmH [Longimicrobiales bacterium]|nr:cytochrome c-type biogenesis protein CcmH [Longimicrobiales bacterium]
MSDRAEMKTTRTFATLTSAALAAVVALVPTAPLQAQSTTGPAPMGSIPSAAGSGHFHTGELGELALALELNLKCNCGSCSLDTHSCQFQMQCGTSPAWSERIRQSLEAGESPEAIEASFVADFGTAVLMSPPAEGFNLVGYLLPSVAIVTAGMFIGLFLRGRPGNREGLDPVTELGDEDAERLRAELRKLDETEGPDW